MMPKSVVGKVSVGFLVAFIVIFAVFFLIAMSGEKGGDTFADNLWLSVPGISAAACGIVAFFTSLVALIKEKDFTVLVILAFIFGFMITSFIAGEMLFPH